MCDSDAKVVRTLIKMCYANLLEINSITNQTPLALPQLMFLRRKYF